MERRLSAGCHLYGCVHSAWFAQASAGMTPVVAHRRAGNGFTLALDQNCFWQDPLAAECLQVLIHGAAHTLGRHPT